jgi:LacI family transcriptional regulator
VNGPRRSTLTDVAQLAGVDKAVVSRVVNADPLLAIRPETRARVEAAIKELDYRPNVAARTLRTARTGTIGLFIPDFANPVYAEIITGAESAALAHGQLLVTASSSVTRHRAQTYLDLLGQGRVDGLLLAGDPVSPREKEALDAFGLPYLFLNRRDPGVDRYVVLDDVRAAAMAVTRLLDLGHTRIAHIAGPASADTAARRLAGYEQALRSRGLPVETDLVVTADYTPQGGADAVRRLLATGVRPSAVFVANVASAIGVLRALQDAGLAVPRDVSVVAVHDLPLAAHLAPPLTTVRMPLRELGARAIELLLSADPSAAITEVVASPIELVERESTAPPRDR